MIESRYTIEYIKPEPIEETGKKKSILLFIFIGLVIITALAYSFLSINKSNQLVSVEKSVQEQVIDTAADDDENKKPVQIATTDVKIAPQKSKNTIQQEIEKLLLENKKQDSKSNAQLTNNKRLNDSINDLTKQLMAEKEKYKALGKRLNSQKNENSQLSELLETALSKVNKTDKSYLIALNKLEEKAEKNNIVITSRNISSNNNNNKKQIDSNIKVVVAKELRPKKGGNYNSISLSTNSQIDAIIAAMQAGSAPAKTNVNVIKTSVDKTKEIRLASVSQASPTELLHIQLQRQIDQIINKGSTNTKTNNTYNKALEKESKVRNNAVRSLTIKKGDTLWSIAQRAYGNGGLYNKIIDANPQINIDTLYVGQVIRVPK